MRRFSVFFIILLIAFLAILFWFRNVILLFIAGEILHHSGLEFSSRSLIFKDGHFEINDFTIKDPTLNLKASRGKISFSWRQRGLKIFLQEFEARYSPSNTPFTPPRYLAELSLQDGKILILGNTSFSIALKKLEVSGLKNLWEGLKRQKALAFQEDSVVGPAFSFFKSLSPEALASLKAQVDLSRLPPDLKEKIPLKKGILQITLLLDHKKEKILPSGQLKLKNGLLLFKEKSIPLEGKGAFSGWWKRDNGKFSLNGEVDLKPGPIIFYSLRGLFKEKQLAISSLSGTFRLFLRDLSPFLKAKFKGLLEGEGEISPEAGNFALKFTLKAGGFQLNEERVGENFSFRGKVTGILKEGLLFSGKILFQQGEIFWAPWYYALEEPLELNFRAFYDNNIFVFKSLQLNGPLEAKIEGLSLKPLAWPKKSQLSLLVEKFWSPLIAEPFGEEYPVLNEISPRGRLNLFQRGKEVEGHFKGALFFKKYELSKIILLAGYVPDGSCKDLYFSWQEIKGPFVKGGPLRITGKICAPKIELDPFHFTLWKGKISSKGGSGNFQERFLVLKKIFLKDLKPELPDPWKKLSLHISGNFEKILFQKGKLESEGELKIFLAGGELDLRDPFFEPGILPRYGGEVEFSGLDLALLSSVSGLGLITGRLRGKIKDLVMVGKLPESFELWLEDDPDYRGKKRISLKAVRQISELGGGSASFFVPFVKNLRYQRLGIYCRLKGDVFYLRGLIKKGGREYLLKGPKLLGVDVINQNPEGAISFKEMVRRLKRILEAEHEKENVS